MATPLPIKSALLEPPLETRLKTAFSIWCPCLFVITDSRKVESLAPGLSCLRHALLDLETLAPLPPLNSRISNSVTRVVKKKAIEEAKPISVWDSFRWSLLPESSLICSKVQGSTESEKRELVDEPSLTIPSNCNTSIFGDDSNPSRYSNAVCMLSALLLFYPLLVSIIQKNSRGTQLRYFLFFFFTFPVAH